MLLNTLYIQCHPIHPLPQWELMVMMLIFVRREVFVLSMKTVIQKAFSLLCGIV